MIADDFIQAPAVVVGGGIAGLATALSLEDCVLVGATKPPYRPTLYTIFIVVGSFSLPTDTQNHT